MSLVTVGDLIDRASDFEICIEKYYADLRDRAVNDGVRLVTYSLARRKRRLVETLDNYSSKQIELIRRIPVKFEVVDLRNESYFSDRILPDDTNADTLLRNAVEFVELLISFYREIAQKSPGEEIGVLFSSLLKIEEKDVIELKKIRAMNYF